MTTDAVNYPHDANFKMFQVSEIKTYPNIANLYFLMRKNFTLNNELQMLHLDRERCYPPMITIIPNTSLLACPVQFQRTEDFSIISIIHLNCNNSLLMNTNWTINRCISNCSLQIQMY
jgi:hypothetical protein